MERRRNRSFSPGLDSAGLEPRQFLSTVSTATTKLTPAERAQQQKEKQAAAKLQSQQNAYDQALKTRNQRIDRLPNFLASIQRGRFVPPEAVASIQNQLRSVIGQFTTPPSAVNKSFVQQIRSTLAMASVQQSHILGLNNAFSQVLTAANAPQGFIDVVTEDMTDLARVDTGSRNPPFLISNDYSLVMQTALAVGKPLPKVG